MKKSTRFLIFGILFLFILSFSASTATGTPNINYYFVNSWGGEADQILNPQGVAWGKDGDIIIANQDLHRITSIDPSSNIFNIWGYQGYMGPLEFQNPYGVTVDKDGFIYSTDGNWNITKTTPNGDFITSWFSLGARAISTDNQGKIFTLRRSVINWDDDFVNVYTTNGELITSWGRVGSGLGNLWFPRGIAADGQFIFIADSANNRVQKFTPDGTFVASWGSLGSGNGQFDNPQGITIGDDGYVYVSDTNNHRIQVFTKNGTYIRKWGSFGEQPGGFNSPVGISINNGGTLAVSDSKNNRIQLFRTDGTYLRQFGAVNGYSSLNNYTGAIDVDFNHNIYIADNQNYEIQKFDENMNLISKWYHRYEGRIWGVTVNQEFLYSTVGCKIQKFDLFGNFIFEWEDCVNGSPRDISTGSDNYIYVNYWGNDSETRKYDANGNFINAWIPEGGWISIGGITLDSSNRVYVSDPNYSFINQFDNNGSFIKRIGTMNGPTGLDAYQDIVFITDQFGYQVYVYNANGDFITSWGGKGTGPGKFIWPAQIATYNAQDVYVGDGNGLQKFSTSREAGVQNGSFENQNPLWYWTVGGVLDHTVVSSASDGNYALQLGAPVNQSDQGEGFSWAYQTIYIDPSIERPVLTFDYNIFANDIIHYSDFMVQILDGTGRDYLETIVRDGFNPCVPGTAPNPGTDLGWRSLKKDLTAYKGESIRVVFANRNLWPQSWGIWTNIDNLRIYDAGPLPGLSENALYLPMVTQNRCDLVSSTKGPQVEREIISIK